MSKSETTALITINCPGCQRVIYVCSLCGEPMDGEWHGLGECVPVPDNMLEVTKGVVRKASHGKNAVRGNRNQG
jgi:hypothetical protein